MDRRQWMGVSALGATACCLGCRTAPITGRRQLMLIPEDNEVAMGRQAFADALKQETEVENAAYRELVANVAERISAVTGKTDYPWETRCVSSNEQNAYALPGGKIVVYSGILPVCQNEAGLAVVMSHEVAHVLARHGGERLSQQSAVNGVRTAVAIATREQEKVSQELWMRAYGMATELGVVLPYSRKHETEADHIGMMLLARAGYDPTEAPRFWTRFAAASPDDGQPEFLSTHPADERRATALEKLLPEALELYHAAERKSGLGETIV